MALTRRLFSQGQIWSKRLLSTTSHVRVRHINPLQYFYFVFYESVTFLSVQNKASCLYESCLFLFVDEKYGIRTSYCLFQSSKMVEFDWTDALNLEGCLSEEEIMVRDAARSYAQVPRIPSQGFHEAYSHLVHL